MDKLSGDTPLECPVHCLVHCAHMRATQSNDIILFACVTCMYLQTLKRMTCEPHGDGALTPAGPALPSTVQCSVQYVTVRIVFHVAQTVLVLQHGDVTQSTVQAVTHLQKKTQLVSMILVQCHASCMTDGAACSFYSVDNRTCTARSVLPLGFCDWGNGSWKLPFHEDGGISYFIFWWADLKLLMAFSLYTT